MNKDKLWKPLLLIAIIILLCSVLSHIFSGSDTLLEYAEKNPELAYPDKEPEQTQTDTIIEDETPTIHESADSSPSNGDKSSMDSPESETETPSSPDTQNQQESEDYSMNENPERIVYQNGFYYEPLSDELIARITGISYPVTEDKKDSLSIEALNVAASSEDIQVDYDELCYMSVLHYNLRGVERTGELICNKAIAQDLVEIFYELYRNEYQIEQIRLIDEYNGDDTLSMQDNNTSCFNYRVVDGTTSLSKHAYGLAIDINPFFNPYVVFKTDGPTYISPRGSEIYADRSKDFAYKIDENDLCYKLFTERGFIWGGNWNSCKDYPHFQKTIE
ncbi:MAG: M15 family metallopeptidase [Kineothrix sp.]|nr:M15 family metallopeptidase [Kineothrix sp.]